MSSRNVLEFDGVFALRVNVIACCFDGQNQSHFCILDFHIVVRDGFLGLSRVYHLGHLSSVVTLLMNMPNRIIRSDCAPYCLYSHHV